VRWKHVTPAIALLLSLAASATSLAVDLKPRVVVLTDIAPNNVEPDDMESMIRLLAHADLFEIEGLVSTTGWSDGGGRERPDLIQDAINAYEKDLPNLRKRSQQEGHLADESRQQIGYWPSPDYLRSRTVLGSKKRGYRFIGAGNNSPGSDLIIQLADERDDRPIWIQVWGGGNTVAQACWQVQQQRSPSALKSFLEKLRVYTITDQDGAQRPGNTINWPESSHQWMRRVFEKDLLFIWDESAWRFQNDNGRRNWREYEAQIQGHGNLGILYPKYKYGVEGDTPSFLHVLPNGLNDPDVPSQAGWGGYFVFGRCKDDATSAYQNHRDAANAISSKYQKYFYPAIFNNFAARMAWARDGAGNRNPMVVVNGDSGFASTKVTPAPGASVTLDASASRDPEGDKLSFSWWILTEAGTYAQDITISGGDSNRATVQVPADSAGKSFHVICEVTDGGTPALSAYRRIIFEPPGSASKSGPSANE
jgi:hypothetical protein